MCAAHRHAGASGRSPDVVGHHVDFQRRPIWLRQDALSFQMTVIPQRRRQT
jgi:hypothetical protein